MCYNMEGRGKTHWVMRKYFLNVCYRGIKNGVSFNMKIFQLYVHKQINSYNMEERGKSNWLTRKYILTICYRGIFSLDMKIF